MILEITETAAMTDVGRCLENLARLRVKGFGLSIDDYGTGYSSMQQLARIPFTELKLDQSFVTNCAMNAQHRAIIESSLDMARRLKLKTVAEGVETHADWTLLRELGCALGQGYFIAKPMAAGEFLGWAAQWEGARRLSGVCYDAGVVHVRAARPGTPSSSLAKDATLSRSRSRVRIPPGSRARVTRAASPLTSRP